MVVTSPAATVHQVSGTPGLRVPEELAFPSRHVLRMVPDSGTSVPPPLELARLTASGQPF